MRRAVKKRNQPGPDIKFSSVKVEKFINSVMKSGAKETARGVVYRALEEVKKKAGVENPLEVFDLAMKNVGPLMEVRSRRVGGANYQVPREVRPERRFALAMKWIMEAARSHKGAPIHKGLADELVLASKGEGVAIKKRDDTHRMAESNKAFAHFAW